MNSHFNDISKAIRELGESQEHCIWVPSNQIVVHQVPVPKAPRRKWIELVPWILEEKLLQTPEEVHFVIAGRKNDKLYILATAKSQMLEWKKKIETVGIKNYSLLPDFLALPWRPGLLCIGMNAEHILVRYGEWEGFAARPELAWHMVSDLFNKTESPLSLSISMPDTELPDNLKDKVEIRHQSLDLQGENFPRSANLLCGEFTLDPSSGALMPWFKTAALLVLTIALGLTSMSMGNNNLSREIIAIGDQNRSDFYNLFPGLTIRSDDIRGTLDNYISNRFRQRESLQSDAMQALIVLDRAISVCNCDLQSLSWSNDSMQVNLPQSVESVVQQWSFEGYQKQISVGANENITLRLSREYGQ